MQGVAKNPSLRRTGVNHAAGVVGEKDVNPSQTRLEPITNQKREQGGVYPSYGPCKEEYFEVKYLVFSLCGLFNSL